MNDAIRRQKGSGLLDIVIAIVLLGVVLEAFLCGFRYISMGTRDNTQRVQALMLAQGTLETIKSNFDGVKTSQYSLTNVVSNMTSPVNRNGVVYNLTLVELSPQTNLKPLQLTVTWNEDGATRSLRMVEYIYLKQ